MTDARSTIESLESAVADFFKLHGITEPDSRIDIPAESSHGDIYTSAPLKYGYVKTSNTSIQPLDIALANYINLLISSGKILGVKSAVANLGYVNFFYTPEFFANLVAEILSDKNFGSNHALKGQKWVIEHTSPNPNKAMHLGHLRNNTIGVSLARLAAASGAKVTTDAIMNDRGIAIAKMMYGFLVGMRKKTVAATASAGARNANGSAEEPTVGHWVENPADWYTPEDLNLSPDAFVTKCYVAGEKYFGESEEIREKVRSLVVRWESGEKNVWKLWEHVLAYSYKGIGRTLARLGNRFDKVWYEHEHFAEGKKWVEKGLAAGIFKKLEDGAVLTDLAKHNISDTILIKNDGTSLYITQDIALTALKKKKYKADKLIWVVGPEQSLVMKQLFAVCEQLKIGRREEFTHVPYGYVALKAEGGGAKKMSSREGTAVLIDELIDTARQKILGEGAASAEVAEKLALTAVKFSLLKSERTQDIVFDVNQSVELKGDSGVYLLYTYARAKSILRKAVEAKKKPGRPEALAEPRELLRLLAFFPKIVERSLNVLSSHLVAQFVLQICYDFNAWYSRETILDGSPNESAKLSVVAATAEVIKNSLGILGIETVEEV